MAPKAPISLRFSTRREHRSMSLELTTDQARVIGRLRSRHRGAELCAHERPWGVIVEVRRRGRTVALTALDGDGGVRTDAPVLRAA
jgi:hypothetical protein